jgi:large subunit ribosomal protein L1
MAKKADLLVEAKALNLDVTDKNTISQIEIAINSAKTDAEAAIAVAKTAEVTEEATETVEEVKTAKAGKRSDKSLAEAEAKADKEARKVAGDTSSQSDDDDESHVTKGPRPQTRPLIERRGKNYQKVAALVEKNTVYALSDALALIVQTNPSKFDASVEVHVKLGVDPRQADQNIRATVSLPNGTGKTIRVAVFAPEADHAGAKAAGADIVGDETLIAQLDKEEINFDILISTPAYMPRLGKYARLLGPRGLMPNPKSGSVAVDVAKATVDAKAGKVEYRVDKQAIVHLAIGKVSFGAEKLAVNAKSFFDSLQSQKPTSLKGAYVRGISISTTQGPGIKVESTVS